MIYTISNTDKKHRCVSMRGKRGVCAKVGWSKRTTDTRLKARETDIKKKNDTIRSIISSGRGNKVRFTRRGPIFSSSYS